METPATAAPVDKFQGRTMVRKVTLPSKGKLYPSLPTGEVRIAAVSSREQKLFSGSGNTLAAKLDLVLERLIDSGTLPANELLLADRLFCLFHIRSLSFGNTYDFKTQCPSCRKWIVLKIDLMHDFTLSEADDKFGEPFEVTLPHSGHRLGLRHLRVKDEKAIDAYVEKNSVNVGPEAGDVGYFYRLARHIVTVDGQDVPLGGSEAVELVQTLEGPDDPALSRAIDQHNIGYDMVTHATCGFCANQWEVWMPFSVEFFRPKS